MDKSKKNIIFYNFLHFGDLHFSREFIKDLYNKLNESYDNFYYYHVKGTEVYFDIDYIKQIESLNIDYNSTFRVDDNNIYINTWIGQGNYKYLVKSSTLYSYCLMFKEMYDYFGIEMEPIGYYIPTIDFLKLNKIYTDNISQFVNENEKKIRVLISNGDVLSNQAYNFDFSPLICNLASTNKDCIFICTDKRFEATENNIMFTNDIIKKNTCDLNEISYLSTLCDFIIGRTSGPYTYSVIKENMSNPNKRFVSISNLKDESQWTGETVAPQIWSNNYSSESIIEIINNEIKSWKNINNIV